MIISKMERDFFDQLKNCAGVYNIVNTINNRYYIGKSIQMDLRLKDHFSALKSNSHQNKKLQQDFNAFGQGAFIVQVIEKINTRGNYYRRPKIERQISYTEKRQIELLNPEYNTSK